LIGAPDETITLDRAQAVLGTAASESVAELTESILTADGQAGLAIIHESLSVGADARQFARQMVSYLRTLLLLQTAGAQVAVDLPAAEKEAMLAQAQRGHRKTLIEAIKNFTEAATAPSTSWQTQLPLELAFIDSLPAVAEPAPVQPVPLVQTEQVAQTPPPVQATQEKAIQEKPPQAAVTRKSVSTEAEPSASMPQQVPQVPSFQMSEFKGKKWREFLAQAGQRNRNYKTWLNSATPLAFEGNTLVIGFSLDFLYKKIQAETQEIGRVLSQVMGAECHVKCVMTDEYNSSAAQSGKGFSEQLKDIAKEVGGVIRDS